MCTINKIINDDVTKAQWIGKNLYKQLLNIFHQALKEDIVPTICSILEEDGTSGSEVAVHALLILSLLNDANIIFLDERLTRVLVNILISDTSSELCEMCLELLHGQAEDGKLMIISLINNYI